MTDWPSVLLRKWMRDAPPKVVRFPIFAGNEPMIVIAAACGKWRRRPEVIPGTLDTIRLVPR